MFTPKSAKTGVPAGSYIYTMYRGYQLTLDFTYDGTKSVEENAQNIADYLQENFFSTLKKLNNCNDIWYKIHGKGASKHNLVYFHVPRDEDAEDTFEGKAYSYYHLLMLSRHEKFLYEWKDL